MKWYYGFLVKFILTSCFNVFPEVGPSYYYSHGSKEQEEKLGTATVS